jgi:hypothetical protein
LITGSGDELCGQLRTLFQAVAYHSLTVGFPFEALFTDSSRGD